MKNALKRILAGSAVEPAARIWWRRLRVGAETGRSARDNAAAVHVMQRILRADSNWLEVGASTGEMLWHVVRCAPQGRHHAFEPVPASAARLRDEFGSRVIVHELAASDAAGESEFQHVTADPGYSGLRRRVYPRPDLEVRAIRVRTERIDDVVPVDLVVHGMKVDVEGAELLVFRGAERILRTWRPYVLFEHGRGAAEAYGATPEMVFDLLRGHGYSIAPPDVWLAGGARLDRAGFVAAFDAGGCNYLAYPA